jgi:hypothetical protein
VLAALAFGAAGALIWHLRPAVIFRGHDRPPERAQAAGGVEAPPAPPGSELTFRSRNEAGVCRRWDTTLGTREVLRFYRQRLPQAGWKFDPDFRAVRRSDLPVSSVLAFHKGLQTCIIGTQPAGGRTGVTALVFRTGGGREGTDGLLPAEMREGQEQKGRP